MNRFMSDNQYLHLSQGWKEHDAWGQARREEVTVSQLVEAGEEYEPCEAIAAYEEGKITEGRLANILGMDRLQLRQFLRDSL